MEIGKTLIAINNEPLVGNTIAPPLELGKEYIVREVILDSGGNPHYDVGIKSKYNFITSYETKEELPKGEKIHWCHPSRFKILN